MKAVRIGAPATLGSLSLVDLPAPAPPGPGEITVSLRASTLNYHDYAVVSGMLPAAAGRIPMSDGAGDVTAVGAGVRDFSPGDAVLTTFFPHWLDGRAPDEGFQYVPGDGMDGYAREAVTAPSTWFTRAPRHLTHTEAAATTCAGVTAWKGLAADGGVKAGDTVLIQGTGGVSIFALQLAKAFGATVIATSSSAAKLDRLKALGADHLINYREQPEWGAAAREITGGRGVDIVVEIGGAGTLPQSIQSVRLGGHIALIGVLAGFAGPIPTAAIMMRQAHVVGVTVGSRQHQLDLIRAMEATGLKPVIDKVFPLDQLADAFRYQESNAHFGKIGIAI
ncbi:NAD(P)-dependent alcohol dehydrogenase [Acidocella sp.]|uniref:zinc-dependent alcohol dehydrogenase family protein n=1 Tax=Acidocella sp. TaxID=50710 RepID=UPI0026299C90|nr:NAD(P)-dependent alcohol dehydrogenase [Acidocella sp.]MDD2795877.1 NAD(P)-dependent alcohol dehydrogenase [Acidocella sp.]